MRAFLALLLSMMVSLAAGGTDEPPVSEPTILELRLEIEGRGDLVIRLRPDAAPRTVARIVELAKAGFYDGQRFFRVVRSPRPYLVQVGDPNSRTRPMDDPSLGTSGSGRLLPFERSPLPNVRGAVGLATLPGRPGTGDSQFYILLADSRFLDGSYTVFGMVTSGFEVLDSIQLGDRIARAKVVLR